MSGAMLASLDPQAPLAQHLLEARRLARWAAVVQLAGRVVVGQRWVAGGWRGVQCSFPRALRATCPASRYGR